MSGQSYGLKRAHQLSRIGVWVAGAMTLASVALISFDVIMRKLFNWSLGGADELSGYAFAISTTWAFAFVVLERANVRVDILYQYFSVRIAGFIDWLSLVALATFLGVMTRYAYEVLATSWVQNSTANTPLATPLWIPQGLWLIGLLWMSVVLIFMLVRSSIALVKGDLATVRKIAGIKFSIDEAREEAIIGQRRVEEDRLR
jgi:TRAP-type C4-dicarboxylate transport system permease small subunit